MKKLILIPGLILLIASCEWLEQQTEIDFTSDFKKSFEVELGEDDYDIDEVDFITATDDDEVKKYKDNLESIVIDSVVVAIEEYDGPKEVLINGTLEYSDTLSTTGIVFAGITDLTATSHGSMF